MTTTPATQAQALAALVRIYEASSENPGDDYDYVYRYIKANAAPDAPEAKARPFVEGDIVALTNTKNLHGSLSIGDIGTILEESRDYLCMGPHHEVRFNKLGESYIQTVGANQMRLVEPRPSAEGGEGR